MKEELVIKRCSKCQALVEVIKDCTVGLSNICHTLLINLVFHIPNMIC